MSIRGITFQEQAVRPEDDGKLYTAIFNDGIIHGCAFSSAGYTLTMNAGHIIACGRQLKATTQNFAMDGASEGYARLLLKIDLNQKATETEFKQIEPVVEYALAENGFAEPLQPDINDGISTVYELPLAVCSLSGNGISKIIKTLAQAEFKEGSD